MRDLPPSTGRLNDSFKTDNGGRLLQSSMPLLVHPRNALHTGGQDYSKK